LSYEHIREDDAWYRERVWREIDIREKMNLPFRYKAEDDNGNQRFISILLRAIKKGDVTAFDPNVDDRFTTPMTVAKVGEVISGRCDSVQVIDWAKDPTGSKGIMKDSLVCKEFNPDDIMKFRIKEEWVFDKESSRMVTRGFILPSGVIAYPAGRSPSWKLLLCDVVARRHRGTGGKASELPWDQWSPRFVLAHPSCASWPQLPPLGGFGTWSQLPRSCD